MSLDKLVLARVAVLLAAGVALAVYVVPVEGNPPGFYRDEASLALSAAHLAKRGRDEHGARFPLYFEQRGDYRSPAHVYALGLAFWVTGPSERVARGLSGILGVLTALTVAALAWRSFGRLWVAAAAGGLTLSTPWLFELSRLAFEVGSTLLAFALVLLLAHEAARRDRWPWWLPLALGLALALLTLSYSTGRIYGPALAVGLLTLATRRRLRALLVAWTVFALAALVPIGVYQYRHPGALQERLQQTTFVEAGMSRVEVAAMFVRRYARQLDVPTWVVGGDSNPRHHVQGTGSILLATAILAVAGLAIVVMRARTDRFARFLLVALAAAPVPVALTRDDYHAVRTAPLPLCLAVLAVPAVVEVARRARTGARWRVVSGLLAAVACAQLAHFAATYEREGRTRREAFEVGVRSVVEAAAAATTGAVFVYSDDKRARTHLEWQAALGHVTPLRVINVTARPAARNVLFARDRRCVGCRVLARADEYTAYLVGAQSR